MSRLHWIHLGLVLCMLAIVGPLAACADAETARRVLHQNGFHNIEITGYRLFGCATDDAYQTGFRAVSTGGQTVTGVVCSGWPKGATVRFD